MKKKKSKKKKQVSVPALALQRRRNPFDELYDDIKFLLEGTEERIQGGIADAIQDAVDSVRDDIINRIDELE